MKDLLQRYPFILTYTSEASIKIDFNNLQGSFMKYILLLVTHGVEH